MELRHLRVLTAIAREGTLSAAAGTLDYTQATVSHHLAALEAELGTRLVDRGRGGAILNERGLALMPHAEAILERVREAEQEVRDLATMRSGLLRIGTFPTAGAQLLPSAVARFTAAHPDVHLTLVEDEPTATLPALVAGELDLAIVFSQPTNESDARMPVALHHLRDDAMRLVLPTGHRLARRRRRLPLAALRDEAWITGLHGGDPCVQMLQQACAQAGFSPRIVLRSDDYEVIRGFVAAGLGIALVPDLGLAHVAEPLAICDLDGPPFVRAVHAALPRRGASSAALELLRLLTEEGAAPARPDRDQVTP